MAVLAHLLPAARTLLVLMLLVCASVVRAEGRIPEYDIKAAFLLNFARFVEWPNTGNFLGICVLGKDPFGKALDDVVDKQSAAGRPIVVRRVVLLEEARQCQILFISSSESYRLPEILTAFDKSQVLTVSEIDGFAAKGGIIGFFNGEKRVGFELNRDAASRARLNISSQLLRVARLIQDSPRRESR
jgi:YfiR/HmsC-like